MTRSPLQHEFSRRTLLRSGLALGAGISLGSLVGCATPTGAPGPAHGRPGAQPLAGQPGQQAQPVRCRAHRATRRAPVADYAGSAPQAAARPGGQVRAHQPEAVVCAPAPGNHLLRRTAGAGAGRRHRPEDVQRGQRLVRRRVLSGVADGRSDRRVQLHAQHRAPSPGTRLPDDQHPDHSGRGQPPRGTAIRRRFRSLRRHRQQPRNRQLHAGEKPQILGPRAEHRVRRRPVRPRRVQPGRVAAQRTDRRHRFHLPGLRGSTLRAAGGRHRSCRRCAPQPAVLQLPQTAGPPARRRAGAPRPDLRDRR